MVCANTDTRASGRAVSLALEENTGADITPVGTDQRGVPDSAVMRAVFDVDVLTPVQTLFSN